MGVCVVGSLGFTDGSIHQTKLDVVTEGPFGDVRQLAQLVCGEGSGVHVWGVVFDIVTVKLSQTTVAINKVRFTQDAT
jgi:hypothetical protein